MAKMTKNLYSICALQNGKILGFLKSFNGSYFFEPGPLRTALFDRKSAELNTRILQNDLPDCSIVVLPDFESFLIQNICEN